MMIRIATVLAVMAAGAVHADEEAEKEALCTLQGEMAGAVQQARLDRVRENKAADKVMEANPHWPEGVATALPALVPFVYSHSRKDLRAVDLGASTKMQCIDNWEAVQEMKKEIQN